MNPTIITTIFYILMSVPMGILLGMGAGIAAAHIINTFKRK